MNQLQVEKPTKEDFEWVAARALCKCLGRRCNSLQKENPPLPDFSLVVDGRQTGLEVTVIMNPSPFERWMEGRQTDEKGFEYFYRFVNRRAASDDRAKELGLVNVWPRIETFESGEGEGIWLYPKEVDWIPCYDELINLTKQCKPTNCQDYASVYFSDDFIGKDIGYEFAPDERQKHKLVRGVEFPKLYQCFTCFDVWGDTDGLSVVYGELEKVELSEKQARHTIKRHLKSLAGYREKLPDKTPVWILLYSEGFGPSRRIGRDSDKRRIESICREELSNYERANKDQFDEVWLGTDVMLGKSLIEGKPSSTSFKKLV